MSDSRLLVAYIRKSKLAAVQTVLRERGATGWSEVGVSGHGRAAGGHAVEHIRLEALVNGDVFLALAQEIARVAHSGAPGDGLIVGLRTDFEMRIEDSPVGSPQKP